MSRDLTGIVRKKELKEEKVKHLAHELSEIPQSD
jgi:hypothetical protein